MEQVFGLLKDVDFGTSPVKESVLEFENWLVEAEHLEAAAGALFFECVFCFCLGIVKDSNTIEKDKQTKITNIDSHWSQVLGSKYNVKQEMIFGPLAIMVKNILK